MLTPFRNTLRTSVPRKGQTYRWKAEVNSVLTISRGISFLPILDLNFLAEVTPFDRFSEADCQRMGSHALHFARHELLDKEYAYRDAKTSISAPSDDPFMGMGQGSGRSNPGCAFTLTPVVNAYKRKGYNATMISAWSRQILLLPALQYVDDTDLLLKAHPRHF